LDNDDDDNDEEEEEEKAVTSSNDELFLLSFDEQVFIDENELDREVEHNETRSVSVFSSFILKHLRCIDSLNRLLTFGFI